MADDENINESNSGFNKLQISIASEDVIRNQWSHGEIKKPETIITERPE